jgi:hypothetical protein
MPAKRGGNNMAKIENDDIDVNNFNEKNLSIFHQRFLEIQNSPNLVVAFIKQIEVKAHTIIEKSFIRGMKDYCKVYADGYGAQKEVYQAKMELEEIVALYNDQELRGEKKDVGRLKVKAEKAELLKKIRELNSDEKKEDKPNELSNYQKDLDTRNEKEKIKQEKDNERDMNRARAAASKNQAYKKEFEEARKDLKKTYETIHGSIDDGWSPEVYNEYIREVDNLKESFDNFRARTS